MTVTDSRRLTGANLHFDGAGAILDVSGAGGGFDASVELWREHVRVLLDALGWTDGAVVVRRFEGGASLAFEAPIDTLYAATEVNEAAWETAVARASAGMAADPRERLEALRTLVDRERNPSLLALQQAAVEQGLTFLWDDDETSVGLGTGSKTWPVDALPSPEEMDWQAHHDVPVALVTGTNGKSTTVRLLGSVLRAAGRTPGLTSTDYIAVGEEIVERGDYSGTGGARAVLRDRRVDVGALEVARGGILRRGLGVPTATAAAVTNVAKDHLGEYGITSVADLARAKFVVAKALGTGGVLVTNADDTYCRKEVNRLRDDLATRGASICWTSPNAGHPLLADQLIRYGHACAVVDGQFAYAEDGVWKRVVPVRDVGLTFEGRATYNVRNCLTVLGLAKALDVDDEAIAEAMASFESNPETNPGRGNRFRLNGAESLVDFAHNEHALSALVESLQATGARRKLLLMGQAGDRTDEEIRGLARAAARFRADCYVLVDMPGYLRGRAPGEVPERIREDLLSEGVDGSSIILEKDPLAGTRFAIDWAGPGDLLLLLSLTQRQACIDLLRDRGAVDG